MSRVDEALHWETVIFLTMTINETAKPICMVPQFQETMLVKRVLSVCYRDHQICTIAFVWVNVCTKHEQINTHKYNSKQLIN